MSRPYSRAPYSRDSVDSSRIDSNNGRSSPVFGRVYWSSTKSVWISLVSAGALLGGYATFSWSALLLCVVLSILTLGAGYSVGIHRRLIHNSFDCPQWLENFLVYLGVLGSTVGPFSAIEQHDLQEWAHRQPKCHSYFAHRQNPLLDWYWSLHCDIQLECPPIVRYEPRVAQNQFYQWLEQTRILQQLPLAIAFYYFGGWSWFFWGIYVRIFLCVNAQWLTQYLAHNWAHRWSKRSFQAPSQASAVGVPLNNLPYCGLLTFGEGWQSNHQSCPHSARFSLNDAQYDPGWWLIKALQSVGLAWNIKKARVLMPLPPVVKKQSLSDSTESPASTGRVRQKATAK